jgi:hypothetical protein
MNKRRTRKQSELRDELVKLLFGRLRKKQPPRWVVRRACKTLNAKPEEVWVQYGGKSAHSGPGWYASMAEYPEEGSVFLGRS